MKKWKIIGLLLVSYTATNVYAIEPITAIKQPTGLNLAQAELGKKLYLILACLNQVLFHVTHVIT